MTPAGARRPPLLREITGEIAARHQARRLLQAYPSMTAFPRFAPLAAAFATSLALTAAPASAQNTDEWLDLSTSFGSGIMRGGHGGLGSAQRAPFFVDVTVLGAEESWLLFGGSLRVELEDGRAVAGIARVVLRHKLSAIELRPGAAIPFYFAPRTMLGPEANLGVRYPLDNGLGLLANAGIAAFMIGNDVPHETTVVMFHLQLGVDLFL